MKSIFLGSEEQIHRVYGADVTAKLESAAGLDGKAVFSKQDIVRGGFGDVEYIFSTWGMPAFCEAEIGEFLPSLKAVFYAAGSVRAFAAPFLSAGVRVFSARAANAVPVIEYAYSQILLANKGFFHSAAAVRSEGYKKASEIASAFPGNYGCSVGIIGAGTIGRGVLKKLREHPLGLYVYDPYLSDSECAALGAEKASLETIFSVCRTVSNHVPDSPSTRGMLKQAHFASMMPYSAFINTGRGAQIEENGLVSVLKARKDVVAILDVTWPEPPGKGHFFYSLPNVLLTPHIAGSSGGEVRRMAEYMLAEYIDFRDNGTGRYEVTAEMLKTMA